MTRQAQHRLFALIALIGAAGLVFGVVAAPSYTDAFYHFNAANRLVTGQEMTDAYVWTYLGALESLPMPSHLYWMPMTSVLSALGMAGLNAPGSYRAAQVPLALALWLTACIGYGLGRELGDSDRHAWGSGLLTLLSPFFARYWGSVDTFAPYALFGSACLVVAGLAAQKPRWLWWAAAGGLAACAHLTRADGLLLLPVAGFFALSARATLPRRAAYAVVMVAAYLLVMSPYFLRNLQTIGTPLPLGGAQAIWFREYNDIFAFPPRFSAETFFADGWAALFETRREALVNNLAAVVAVEGVIVLLPFMIIGLWTRRRDRFLHPFAFYALGMHLTMTFIFPFPGYRGGLFHSAAALIPFWSVLGLIGLDRAVEWAARRRRRWQPGGAKAVFSGAALMLAAGLTVFNAVNGRVEPRSTPQIYAALKDVLPEGARILFDDPPELYYYTGFGGATLPNGTPDDLLAVARRYDIDYLLLKEDAAAIPVGLLPILDAPPAELHQLEFEPARLYVIDHD
ncbi:MAG: glycosyltransferase family 39 protein [Anaerolineae bacterium]|nr:glycosyltransferase family 39 protein [Anaerolineae bacterium]